MADPILPNIIRAQVILHGKSALPEDRFVNTFAFEAVAGWAGEGDDEHLEALRLLTAFYTSTNGGTSTIVSYLAGYTKAELRTYHLGDAVPREPVITDPWTGFPAAGSGPLPQEVALCASFQSDRRGPRGRGRVYLGPLRTTAMGGTTTDDARPVTQFSDAARQAMVAMAADSAVLRWGVVSPTDGAFYPVTGGWVDNAFDTQRSRGSAPTTRLPWGSAV